MSNWTSLENELRKWTPRPASPELRQRIFGVVPRTPSAPAPLASAPVRFADLTQWLVPVFGCFLLVIGTLSSRYPVHGAFPLGAATNMLLSDNSAAYNEAILAASADHSDKNSLPAPRLEWSFGNQPGSTSSYGAVQASYTNKIIQ